MDSPICTDPTCRMAGLKHRHIKVSAAWGCGRCGAYELDGVWIRNPKVGCEICEQLVNWIRPKLEPNDE